MWYDTIIEFCLYQYYTYFPPKPVAMIEFVLEEN